MSFTDVARDLPPMREYELDNNKVRIQREDPFGFWYLHFDRGQMPDRLKGAYTSLREAEIQLFNYMENKNRDIKPKAV